MKLDELGRVETALYEVIDEFTQSGDAGERKIGNILLDVIEHAPNSSIIPILRIVTGLLENALTEFEKRWNEIAGE